MNVWGLFVLLFGLVLVVVAYRNSVGNLAPLVPGAGTGGPTMAASGSGGATSATAPAGAIQVVPALTGLYTAPRAQGVFA